MAGFSKTIEYGIGVMGLVALLAWLGFIAFLISVGELETTGVLVIMTLLGLYIMSRNVKAA